ncbi:MMPL family transporter [Streptomyces antimicrobicus]|uniref:MMPL family transporter n=1 Tax=Streptomyces antimicrobicus TaxID=2883108 RepID=A0ABS8BC32_9ACTN|nr:MMPL family transporter [Streptomyces antimicrobicus]MCB5182194.1 MMPL family transporter [Streptomyces antimicrobicus]
MFRGIGRLAVRRPWLTIAAWIVLTVATVMLAPKLPSTTDQAEFLPSKYETVQVMEVEERAFPREEQPAATIVFKRSDGGKLAESDQAVVAKVAADLTAKNYAGIKQVVTGPPMLSPNGEIMLAAVTATSKNVFTQEIFDSVKQMRLDAREQLGNGPLSMGITGQAASAVDSMESAGDTDSMIMLATLALIVVLLLAIFRSPLIALLPVVIITLVFAVATGLIATASKLGGLKADASVSSILIVVLFGVGTDYILFLLFRYREQLRTGVPARQAMAQAVERVGETIASAAGAVIVAFLALLLSSMGMLRTMGPALAISVAVTAVASLTLVPAVFALLGTKAFWPSKAWRREPKNALSHRTANLVARRPGVVAAVSAGILVALTVGLFGFTAEYDANSSLPKHLESVKAQDDLARGFAAGATEPTLVYLEDRDGKAIPEAALKAFGERIGQVEGVGQVSPPRVSPNGSVAQFSVVLDHKPAEDKALALVEGPLRDTVHAAAPEGSRGLVGGSTALLADIRDAVNRDYAVVFPAAGVAIMIILGLLLRSAVAPWYLMAAVGLGFSATLGATVVLFQKVQGQHGLLFMLPVMVYLFVVAIGTDYNILMVARLREEAGRGKEPKEATRLAVAHSMPTVATAGIILAGTFAVLMLAQNSMLQQMGFAVSFGILLTAFVMAVLLVPAVTALLGHRAWLPGRPRASAPESGAEVAGPGAPATGGPVAAGADAREAERAPAGSK